MKEEISYLFRRKLTALELADITHIKSAHMADYIYVMPDFIMTPENNTETIGTVVLKITLNGVRQMPHQDLIKAYHLERIE